ncbi:MAG: MBL fold metallo-hydrolase [Methanobacterium sp.]
MEKFTFIARMPNEPGALHKAAKIAKDHNGNIHRIHYNRKIDPNIVFFEIFASYESYEKIKYKLEEIGYLQTSLKPVNYLKFNILLPDRSGALFELLNYITSANANIGFLDFDERSNRHDQLTVSVTVDNSVETLLDDLKSNYRLEIIEYDRKGEKLDDTLFYIDFAQNLGEIIGNDEDEFLIKLLGDINHIVQELTRLGEDPKRVFESILQTGNTLKNTTGSNFSADVQKIQLSNDIELYCFQPPCGGNVFVINSPEEMMLIDSGYGIYYPDFLKLFVRCGIQIKNLKAIYLTHADADHSGAAGFYNAPSFIHKGTIDIINESNRAYGSNSEECILEEVYTRLINLFSKFNIPTNMETLPDEIIKMRGPFPIIHTFKTCGLEFEVLESLGGHLHGQIFILCPDEGLLFTADSLINFASLSEERKKYNLLAKDLMTSVNVDGKKADEERKALLKLALLLDEELSKEGKKCLICGGHGAISVLSEDKLEVFEQVKHL